MSKEEIHQIEEVFQAAADLPPHERAAFLDRECAGNGELRAQVTRMLERLEDATPRLTPMDEGRAYGPFMVSDMTEGPGTVIDRYKLLQKIGDGGFGVVYMAEQQRPVVRKVALKIIKLGMDTREVVARFEAERQALALMDHPNIARVLDGGATNSGRPFFVMELVRGVSITEFCDKNALTTRDRLNLFLQVCHALQHAHQKGVIHRDIKPSNVMVTLSDTGPTPKVIDFGVAKAMHARLTEKTLFTRYEQFVGTPAYMSPEQAEMTALDVDTRTDIYSLGVLLYEILTGSTPFDTTTLRNAGLAEIQRIICHDQPQRPSLRISSSADAAVARHRGLDIPGLCRALHGDLDWIVLKALEKDRNRRYATAGELGEDIRRHLAREPVMAGPPGAGYRFRKLLARNRAAVFSAALVALALVIGMITTTTAMIRADHNAELANEQTQRAMTAVDFLLSTLSLTNPEVALSPDVSVRTLLDHTSDRVAEAFTDFPGAEVRVRATIGRAYARLGLHELAEPHLRRVVEMVDDLTERGSGSREILHNAGFTDLEYYATLWTLTNVLFSLERTDAFPTAGRSSAVGMAILAETHSQLTDMLVRLSDEVQAGAWSHAPDAMANVPDLFQLAAKTADEMLPQGDPQWSIIVNTFLAAGYMVWYTPHEPHAETFWRKALEIQRRELPPNHPDIATTVNLFVGILNSRGKLDEMEALLRDSVGTLRKVYSKGALALAVAEGALGKTLTKQGRFEEAEPILLQCHEDILANVKDEANFIAVESYVRMVDLYDSRQQPERATPYRESLIRTSVKSKYRMQWVVFRSAFGPEHRELVEVGDRFKDLSGGISFLATPGTVKNPELDPTVQRFIDLVEQHFDREDSAAAGLARLMLGWANTLDPEAHHHSRARLARSAYNTLGHWIDILPADYAEAAAMRADDAGRSEKPDEAARYAQEARRVLAHGRTSGDWFVASQEVRIARTLLARGLYADAEELLLSGYDVLRNQLGNGHADTVTTRALLYQLYTELDRQAEAGKYRDESAAGG